MGNILKLFRKRQEEEGPPTFVKYKLRWLPIKKLNDLDYERLSHFSDADALEIKDIFDRFLKTHPDGSMDRTEFSLITSFLRKKNKEEIEKITEDVFRALGFKYYEHASISFREFLLMFTLISNKGDLSERLSYAFDLYDLRHKKGLQLDEIREIIFIVLELHRKPDNTRNLLYEGSDIFKNIQITQVVTRDNFLNGLIGSKTLRNLISFKAQKRI